MCIKAYFLMLPGGASGKESACSIWVGRRSLLQFVETQNSGEDIPRSKSASQVGSFCLGIHPYSQAC